MVALDFLNWNIPRVPTRISWPKPRSRNLPQTRKRCQIRGWKKKRKSAGQFLRALSIFVMLAVVDGDVGR